MWEHAIYYVSADQFLFFLGSSFPVYCTSLVQVPESAPAPRADVQGEDYRTIRCRSRSPFARCTNCRNYPKHSSGDDRDLHILLSIQSENGSWKNGWFYGYGLSGILVRSDGVTTALAIRAIQEAERLPKSQHQLMTKPNKYSMLIFTLFSRSVSVHQ